MRVLLDRHADSVREPGSVNAMSVLIDEILSESCDLVKIPAREHWPVRALEEWIRTEAMSADSYLATSRYLIRRLRSSGWSGRLVVRLVDDLAQGAVVLRDVLPFLSSRDVVWLTSASDLKLYELFVKDIEAGPRPVLIPYGFDSSLFGSVTPKERQEAREQLHVDEDDFVILYVGRVTLEKNVHRLIRAIRTLRYRGVPARLLVIGRSENRGYPALRMYPTSVDEQILGEIAAADEPDCVQWLEWVDRKELRRFYGAADVFANLSLHPGENFGNVAVEAMACGLPVVASAWGGMKDTVDDGVTGYLVDTWVSERGTRASLVGAVDALEHLWRDRETREAMQRFAVERVEARYSMSTFRQAIQGVVYPEVSGYEGNGTFPELSEFGQEMSNRFSIVSDGEVRAEYPVYESLADKAYMAIAARYANAQAGVGIEFGAEVALCIAGYLLDNYFYSSDRLWRFRVELNEDEYWLIHSTFAVLGRLSD